ncbi:hypothetical protein CXB77_07930 [Chromatium okenii]|uniref:Porin domain-containing protein n=2 Tax=Chromatium okenii TaxID=61644 RepID=A0A2S7XSG8_9GAMM|nr:hypothetical protein CXB77_07930 [Chromatium okenii]
MRNNRNPLALSASSTSIENQPEILRRFIVFSVTCSSKRKNYLGKIMRYPLNLMLVAFLTFGQSTTRAVDFSWSGYGTLGYAISDQPYNTQRFINNRGTLARDSLFGVQLDAKFNVHWSATVQAQISPADDDDNAWNPKLSWAFLSWRPNNDWLLRLGKLRVPGYLNSENMDVGWTFDYARLPIDVYSTSPTVDFTGASISKIWELGLGDLNLELFWGKADSAWRSFIRDPVPGYFAAGADFSLMRVQVKGVVLSLRNAEDLYRFSFYKPSTEHRIEGQEWNYHMPLVSPFPGISYYAMRPEIGLGTEIPSGHAQDFSVVIAGMDIGLGHDIRFAGEYVRRLVKYAENGLNSNGGYTSLRKRIGKWTPYLYYAWLRSEDNALELNQALNQSSVPKWFPNALLINAAQRAAADVFVAYDQQTWALGTSYALTPTSKLKLEWARTHVGMASSFVDSPAGGDVSNQDINLFSLSYNFVF